jgi:hypothetical protein
MNPGVFVSSILCFSLFVLDLLTRDYSTDQKFSISTNSVSGVALTSTALKNGVLHAANVATQYKYRNTFFDVKIDTDFNILTTITSLRSSHRQKPLLPSKCLITTLASWKSNISMITQQLQPLQPYNKTL